MQIEMWGTILLASTKWFKTGLFAFLRDFRHF